MSAIGACSRWRCIAVPMVLGALALAGCGDDDSGGATAGDELPESEAGEASAFVGLTTEEAIEAAESEDRPWRIGREDEEQYPVTLDFIENRVTFEIDDGMVTAATLG